MKNCFTLRPNTSLIVAASTLALSLLSLNADAATIFTENMGTGTGGNTAIASSTFQNSGTYTYTGTGDTRTSTASSGYVGASGGRNVFLTNTIPPRTFQMDGIVTTGYTNLSLSFGGWKSGASSDMTALVVEYSTDGSAWNTLTFPAQPTASSWRLVTITGGTIPAAANLRLRWSNSTSEQFRIDDVKLTGDVAVGPNLSAGPLTAFGAQCINAGPYGPNSFTITGTTLTSADVTVGALSGFTYSTTALGTYTSTLSLTQAGGAYSQAIYVQFDPTAVASYNGNIPVGGGGATSINVAASGSGVDTAPTVSTGTASAITMATATVAGTLDASSSCGTITAYGIEYSTTLGFANGTGTQVAGGTLTGTAFSSNLTGLSACTTYYTHAYATRSAGTTYGAEGSFTTDAIGAPVAAAGSGITADEFTASWAAVTGAASYQLDVSTSPTFGSAGGQLIGWDFADNNTTADSGIPANSTQTISSNATGTLSYSSNMIVYTGWDGGSNSKYWQIELSTTGYAGLTLSSVQQSSNTGPKNFKVQYRIGAGGAWTDVSGGSVTVGNNTTTGVLNDLALPVECENEASVFLRWIMTSNTSVNNGTVAGTGTSRIDDISVDAAGAPSFVPGYNNLSVAGTSQAVTGLDALTTYYYRVRTVGASCTSENSNVIDVTTTAGTSPLITAGTLTDFGTLCQGTESIAQSVTVDGFNLTAADVTVAALAGFSYSTTELGTYTATLSIPQAGGAFSQDFWVKFTPPSAANFDGDITIGGGGAPDVTVAVTGTGVNTEPTLTTGTASAINTSSATLAGQITDAGCGTITAYGIEFSTTMGFTPGTGTQVASTNLSGSDYSSDLASLNPCTPYYYVAYATRASGTTYGSEQSFTTATISAPAASAGTAVGTNGFTANWGTVSGATAYRLDVYTQSTTLATDLFISEYVEGSGNNKYIEIFNGTGASVNLSDYELRLFSNGASSPSNTAALTGTLANNTTRVYRNSSAAIYLGASTSNTAVGFNGDDAVALYKVSASSYVDIIGEIGNDPGSAWTDGGLSTENRTLVRKANVSGGVTTNPTGLGFPTLASEWDGYPVDDVSRLGSHTFNSITQTFVPGYNDLSVAGTSEVVTGLDPGTTYYYAVRAEYGTCTSANSDEIEVTTVSFGCTDPLADNYDPGAVPDNSLCTYCAPSFTYDTPTPTPITIGSGIPDQHMAVADDCHDFNIAINAYERFVPGGIVPTGKVYTTTTGFSPTSASNPTPDPNNARWNFLVSVDLGTYDFTEVAVYMDMDFDPGMTPIFQTVDISALAVSQGQGASNVQQQAQNMKSAFWSLLFPGISFDATIPGIYDLRIRVVSPTTGVEMISHDIQIVVEGPGCTDPLADNYDPDASSDDGSCTYCTPTYTYNTPTPTPIAIGSGIPDQNMAVSEDCLNIDVALSAFERYVPGGIAPVGNVYTTTVGNSPTSPSDPTPDPNNARWNILGSIDLGTYDFTEVNVFLDLDFDPAAIPVWNTINLSQGMIDNSMGGLHVYQASENLASPFWSIAFPGIAFDASVAGIYDVRVRLESVHSGEELVSLAIQVVVEGPGCTDPLADNYDANANPDDGSCIYCPPTITYNTPTPTPILIGSGIPDQNMAVSQDCRGIDVAMSASERYVGAIIPVGNVYTTTVGNSPTSGSDPTPDPNNARWNILGSIDLGVYDFTQVDVFLDLDFDPAAIPVWNTIDISQNMIDNSMGGLHVYQASENLASPFWSLVFPGVTFDPNVPGIYDVRVRLESVHSGEELVSLAIQIVVDGCVAHTGNVWYVNDADLTGDLYTTAVGSDSNPGTASCPFGTIAYAITQAASGDIIMVDAGVYAEDLVIDKQVDLRGVQYDVDPTTRIGAESTIHPATSDPNPASPTATVIILLDDNVATGTKINGFTIDGDNPALTSGVEFNGADMDAIEAIASYLGNGDLDVAYNVIKNIYYVGIDIAHYGGPGSVSGITIRENVIDNTFSTQYGIGIGLQYNAYADITNNTMTRSRIAIQTGNQIQPSLGTPPVISGNSISSTRIGIFHNVQYTTATPFTISNNDLFTESGALTNTGIFIGVLDPTTSVTLLDNNVTGAQYGIMLWGSNSAGGVTIEGGTITDCGTGVFVNNYDAYPPSPNQTRSTDAIVKDVTIVNASTGIHVKDNALNTNAAATVHVDIVGSSTINVADDGINVLVTGAKASANFAGTDVDLTGDALRHIRLESNGYTVPSVDIDATQVQFNGATAVTATGFAIENLIDHKVDLLTLGKVSFVPGEVFVTVESFVNPNTVGSVQRGIDVAVANDIVHVNDGTYNEDVNVNKVITLLGNDQDLTILRGLYGTTAPALSIGANATVENLTSTRDYGNTTAEWQASPKTQGVQFFGNNASMNRVLVTGHRNGVYINNRQNIAVTNSIIENNRTGIQLGNTVSGTTITNNFIRDNFTMGLLFNFDLSGTPDITGLLVNENSITGNWYGDISFQGTPSSAVSGADFSCNWYGTTTPVVSATATSEPGYGSQVPSQFGGTAPAAPAGQIMGVSAALVPYSPYGTDGTDDDLLAPGFQPVPGACQAIYYSQSSGDVSDPIWDVVRVGTPGPATFTSATSMVIQDTHAVVNTSDTEVNDLNVELGGTLTLGNSTELNVNGDEAIFDGTLVAQNLSTLLLSSTDATILESTGGLLNFWNLTVNTPQGTLTDATIYIRGTLLLSDGDFDASLGTVRLSSNASRTGHLGQVSPTADFIGDLTVQRFIPGGVTNWRMLGSPVEGRTVADWDDDFITAGFPGSNYPTFDQPVGSGVLWPSVRAYDETDLGTDALDGMNGVTSITQALTPGQGFAVWCGDNLGGTNSFVVDVIGTPTIARTPIALPTSYTTTGNEVADGWNLVSNPLPSALDFTTMTVGADLYPGYYIFDPISGSTANWDEDLGISTPAGLVDGTIQSSQAFWLHAKGANDFAASVSESDKVSVNTGGVFGGDNAANLPIMRLTVAGSTGTWSDQATLAFVAGTPALDVKDAVKLDFSHPSAPRIATRTSDGFDLIVNKYGTEFSNAAIPVTVRVPSDGTYTITVSMSGIEALTCFTLEDLLTGTITPVYDGSVLTFSMNTTTDVVTDRFVLRTSTAMPYSAAPALCNGTATGQVAVQVSNGPVDLTLADAFGAPLQVVSGVANGEYVFDALMAGNYTVSVGSSSACGNLSGSVLISEPFALAAVVEVVESTCGIVADGRLDVSIQGGVAPYTYQWGDGSTGSFITGVAGNYSAVVIDASGCSMNVEMAIPAGGLPEVLFESSATTVLVNEPVAFTNLSSNGTDHLWNFGDGTTSTDLDATHSYALPGVYTVVLTENNGTCEASVGQDINVQLTTSVSGTAPAAFLLNVWGAADQLVVEHSFDHGNVVLVDVLDATGRLHMQKQFVGTPGRVSLPAASLSTGVWFVRVTSGDVQHTFRVPLLR